VQGRAVDLVAPPWHERSDLLSHPTDHAACQALARHCRADRSRVIFHGRARQLTFSWDFA